MSFDITSPLNKIYPINPWIIIPEPRPQARLRLLCLPYGGVGSAIYFPWNKYLPKNIELCLIRLPGRETRLKETPFTRLLPLVEELAQALAPFLDRPFAVFGHSMGALIGFEFMHYQQDLSSRTATHLFVSGRRAAQLPDPNPPLHKLPDLDLVKEVQSRYNGIPKVILQDDELLQLFLPTLRADIELIETYCFQGTRLDIPISAFSGRDDVMVSEIDVASWGELTLKKFRMRIFPGDHFYLQNHPDMVIQEIVTDLSM